MGTSGMTAAGVQRRSVASARQRGNTRKSGTDLWDSRSRDSGPVIVGYGDRRWTQVQLIPPKKEIVARTPEKSFGNVRKKELHTPIALSGSPKGLESAPPSLFSPIKHQKYVH